MAIPMRQNPLGKRLWSRRRRVALVVTIFLAAVIILGGTYAWTSIGQEAYNEASGTPNPGGRIHDDYDYDDENPDANKDVYAENFGNVPLFVRVQLREYMEVGSGAGLKSLGGGVPNPGNNATPFKTGTDIDNKGGWPVHIPDTTAAECLIGEDGLIHQYVTWIMGGSKVFMPTFNKDLNDLSTEASGDAIDKIAQGQTAVGRDDAGGDVNDGSHDYWADGETVTADEISWDPMGGGGTGAPMTTPGVEHTAKYTLLPGEGGVMMMAAWKAAGSPTGNFWVYDADGWAYWANALQPGEATSLLLNGISVVSPDEDWYYCIDVVGQFVTEADLSQFGENGETITADGECLMDLAAGRYAITLDTNALDVVPGDTHQFTAALATYGGVSIPGATITWSIDGPHRAGTTISASGFLTVDSVEYNDFTVRASWKETQTDCAVIVARPNIPVGATSFTDSTGVEWRVLKDNRPASGVAATGGTSDGTGTMLILLEHEYGTLGLGSVSLPDEFLSYNTTNVFTTYENSNGTLKSVANSWYDNHVSEELKAIARIPNLTYEATNYTAGFSDAWDMNAAISTPGAAAGTTTDGILFPLSVSEINRFIPGSKAATTPDGLQNSWWTRSPGDASEAPTCRVSWLNQIMPIDANGLQASLRSALWIDTTP